MRLTLFLLLNILTTPTFASLINPVPASPGNLHLGFSETYFRSQENLVSGGEGAIDLPNSGLFQEFQGEVTADWDINSNWRLKSNLSFSFVQTETNTFSRESSHPDKVGLGVERWSILGRTPVILYTQVLIPVHSPDLNSIDAFGTDGAFNGDLGLVTRPRFGNLIGDFGVGYTWRSENLSHLLPWTASLSYSFNVGQIGAGLRGFQTLVKDSASTQERARRSTAIQNGQAQSLKYLSTDPQVQQVFIKSRWGIFKGLDLSTDIAYDLNGQSYARGFYVGAGIHWLIDMHSIGSPGRASSSGFEVESDQYRGELFNDADPARAPRPQRRRPPQKSLDQLMDETEDALEP